MIGSNSEWEHFNSIEERLLVDEQLLSVPDIVKINSSAFWVLNTCWVTASNKVGNSAVNTGAGVPEDFSGTTVVHR